MNRKKNKAQRAKAEITADKLNNYFSRGDVFFDPSNGDEVTILGNKMLYTEESDVHSDSVKAYLYGENVTFEREGIKEISYGNWVSTHWVGEWELA